MNSGILAKSLAKSLARSVSAWGLTTLLLSWATVSSARPTSPPPSVLSAGTKQALTGCQASSQVISGSKWQISAPREPNLTKPDEIVQIGLRNSQGANVPSDRVVARVLAPDGSLAAAYPTLNRDRFTYLTYPLDFSGSRPTQAGTYTVVLEVNGQSVLCDRFVVAQPSLIDTAFDNDLTGRKLELDLETFLNSDDSSSEPLLFASNPTKAHNRLFSLSSPSNPLTANLDLDTANLLSPDPNPLVKETASAENSSSNASARFCFYAPGRSFNSSNWQDNIQEQQSDRDLEDFMESLGCPRERDSSDFSTVAYPSQRPVSDVYDGDLIVDSGISGDEEKVTKVVEPSSVFALLFLTTTLWIGRKKN